MSLCFISNRRVKLVNFLALFIPCLRIWKRCCAGLLGVMLIISAAAPAHGAVAGEITFYVNRVDLVNNGSYARWAREFKAIYPAATVRIQGIENYEANMPKRFESRSYGDVMLVPRDMPKQNFSNFFVPLNDIGLDERIYFPDIWEYEGKHYAYTQGVIAEGLVYHKKIFAALDSSRPPTTQDEFFAVAEQLKAKGIVPIALNVGAAWPLQQWDKSVMAIAGDGNYFARMTRDPAPFSTGKPYAESLRLAYQIFARGYSEPDFILNNWEASKKDFADQKVAMFYLGNWVIPQLIEAGVRSADIGFVPFPLDNSGEPKGVLNFDWGIAVSRYSRNQETAKAWVEFMLTRSNFADVAGFIPTEKARQSGMPQLSEYMSYQPLMIQPAPESNDFIRLTNKAGMDFMSGSYIRNVLISPDFEGSMDYLNRRWRQAKENY